MNKIEPVPDLPIPISIILEYVNVGQEFVINTRESPYLNDADKTVHELEIYLHGMAKLTHGGSVAEGLSRDIALVNKGSTGLTIWQDKR
ncbi:hypothetical protein PanWU01x14_122780 [Parasponia andersonii]|uniref:Phospholipase A1 n=1 Tax=Parasponia andersonii TaxID=3476 RepID=A0A2P5CUD7_PARAD|nr:hypothetical protein PanWU01x14_122780 [Parasponia andersonii]